MELGFVVCGHVTTQQRVGSGHDLLVHLETCSQDFQNPGLFGISQQQREALCLESPVSGMLRTQRSVVELPGSYRLLCKGLSPWGKRAGEERERRKAGKEKKIGGIEWELKRTLS